MWPLGNVEFARQAFELADDQRHAIIVALIVDQRANNATLTVFGYLDRVRVWN